MSDFSLTFPTTFPAIKNKVQHFTSSPRHFAFLIGANTEDRHRNNISLAYQVLIESGYNPRNVFIVDSEGGNPAIFPLDATATTNSIKLVFETLRENITKEDTIFIYLTGHGEKKDDEVFLLANKQEKVSYKEFISEIMKLHPKSGIVFFDNCYFGVSGNRRNEFSFISVASFTHVSIGNDFARYFFRYIRDHQENRPTVYEAFEFAKQKDKDNIHATFKGKNLTLLQENGTLVE